MSTDNVNFCTQYRPYQREASRPSGPGWFFFRSFKSASHPSFVYIYTHQALYYTATHISSASTSVCACVQKIRSRLPCIIGLFFAKGPCVIGRSSARSATTMVCEHIGLFCGEFLTYFRKIYGCFTKNVHHINICGNMINLSSFRRYALLQNIPCRGGLIRQSNL